MTHVLGKRFLSQLRTACRRQSPAPLGARPYLEVLSARILPSVTANLANGILDIIADDVQQDGQLLQNLQGAQVAALFAGQLSLADFAAADSADLLAGINGSAQLSYQGGGWNLPLSLLDSSALYSPGNLDLAGVAAP